ncbi:MAG: hypothetical protein KZQ92_16135, partial [Candidatus Thiodiazotropha sp. (ex Lucinoma borealis)]|nr:hypothetical protein [Candidatus Thiodiazotropha sp. (ex Lucinoma borealis)]
PIARPARSRSEWFRYPNMEQTSGLSMKCLSGVLTGYRLGKHPHRQIQQGICGINPSAFTASQHDCEYLPRY